MRTLVAGAAAGVVLVLEEPLSLWGGLDPATGRVIDVRHPQHGAIVTDRVLVMPGGRGSSSSSSALAEAIRAGTAPAAIVLGEPDPILALGAIVGRELFGARVPVVALDEDPAPAAGTVVRVVATPEGARLEPVEERR